MSDHTEIYTVDTPLVDPTKDRFRRLEFARRVAETLAKREDSSSLTVAINGAWGEGKTTVLEYIASALHGAPGITCIRFNPWRFADEPALLRSFFHTLAASLGHALDTKLESLGQLLQRYGGIASVVPSVKGVADVGDVLATVSLDELKNRIEKCLLEENKRVVVLIDDIDRLGKEEIYAVFRLVKLTADFPLTSYVLAFDHNMVADALATAYGSRRAGREFLEKIIQVPLTLPSADPKALREFCLELVYRSLHAVNCDLEEGPQQDFLTKFLIHLAPRLNTPRTAKRYANALAFAMPLLRSEVNPLDVILLEGMKVFYPRVYAAIRRKPWAFTGGREQLRVKDTDEDAFDFISRALIDVDPEVRDMASNLLVEVFPQIRGLLSGRKKFESPSRERWDREQRVASPDYLQRYLTLSVPQGDIPDRTIEEFLQVVNTLEDPEVDHQFAHFCDAEHRETFLYKLQLRASNISLNTAARLALVVARNGSLFPRMKPGELMFFAPMIRAKLLVSVLLRRIEDTGDRTVAAGQLLERAEPLTFAWNCLIGMRTRDTRDELFDEPSYKSLEQVVAGRIAKVAEDNDLRVVFPDEWIFLVWHWSRVSGREAVYGYTQRLMSSDPKAAVSLIMEQFKFLPHSDVFSDAKYNDLKIFSEPSSVTSALEMIQIDALPDRERQVVKEFRLVHSKQTNTLEDGNGASERSHGETENVESEN